MASTPVLEALDARPLFLRPIAWKPESVRSQDRYYLTIQLFGRLKTGITRRQALTEATSLERLYYDAQTTSRKEVLNNAGYRIDVGELRAERVRDVKTTLVLLQCGAALVFAVGCVNGQVCS